MAGGIKAKKHKRYRIIIWLVALVCLYESLTKGWGTLLLLPASAVLLPMYIIVQYAALRHEDGPYGKQLRIVAILLTVTLLTAYICTVGFGDTDQVLLFGFYTALDTSALTRLSEVVSAVAYMLVIGAFAGMLGLLAASRRRRRARSAK